MSLSDPHERYSIRRPRGSGPTRLQAAAAVTEHENIRREKTSDNSPMTKCSETVNVLIIAANLYKLYLWPTSVR